jgi:hypothetical protein
MSLDTTKEEIVKLKVKYRPQFLDYDFEKDFDALISNIYTDLLTEIGEDITKYNLDHITFGDTDYQANAVNYGINDERQRIRNLISKKINKE